MRMRRCGAGGGGGCGRESSLGALGARIRISVRWDAGRDARAAERRTGGGRRRRRKRNRHADVQSGRPDGHQTRLALRPRALWTCHRHRPQNCQQEVLEKPQRPT